MLFPEAEDPLRALRWTLAELRRAFGDPEALRGDPLELRLAADTDVDVHALLHGDLSPELADRELLEGLEFDTSPAFDAWLRVERRRLGGAGEALLRDAALARLSEGRAEEAAGLAGRAVALNPLDENHQELLVRCLAQSGDMAAAARQVDACGELFRRELGRDPGVGVRSAASEAPEPPVAAGDAAAAAGQLHAGLEAISSGAVGPGIECLRLAAAEAAASGDRALHARCLTALGSALVRSVRGRDEEGAAVLHVAATLSEQIGEREIGAEACGELGWVEVQAGRSSSAGRWLARATDLAERDEQLCTVLGIRGMALSDHAHYAAALALLDRSVVAARRCGDVHRAAWSLSIAGRAHLLREELDEAAALLDESLELVERDGWIAFRAWPATLRAEVDLLGGRAAEAEETLKGCYRLACRIADPCWEGISARATGLLHRQRGDAEAAEHWFDEALRHSSRVSDRYVWVYLHALDAAAGLAVDTGAERAPRLVAELTETAARTGMRELVVRAKLHAARLGEPGARGAARLLAAEIDNPALKRLVAAPEPASV